MANETGEATEPLDPVTIGLRVRRIRHSRGKSLEVVAGQAKISAAFLSRLERGEYSLDRLTLIVRLADALEVAPSELIALPVPAPGNGGMDSAIHAVRRALRAANSGQPDGQVLPVETLRERVTATLEARCHDGKVREVGAALPALIRDVHTSIAAGRDVAALLDLAVLLHTRTTEPWLRMAGAPPDLREHAAVLARRLAERRDTPATMVLAVTSAVDVALAAGDFDFARAELDTLSVPTTSPESLQLGGVGTLQRSFAAAADGRSAEADAALAHADELAQRTGEANAYWMGFGPTCVGLWQMAAAREAGDPERAVTIAEGMHPEAQPDIVHHARYHVQYARALVRVRGRREDAVRALRRAETLVPHEVQRNPAARELLGELVTHAKRGDAVSRELRGMAYRAGLPV